VTFHANPFGRASICKVGREPNIDLRLTRLGSIAGSLTLSQRQAQISPHMQGHRPELHWHIEEDGCSVLGFAYRERPRRRLLPEPPNLPAVMTTMTRPAGVSVPSIDLKTMPHRLRTYVDNLADPSWFAGASLQHHEWNPHNVRMTRRKGPGKRSGSVGGSRCRMLDSSVGPIGAV
jgi:hypothetical protein